MRLPSAIAVAAAALVTLVPSAHAQSNLVSTVAGTGTQGAAGDEKPATEAQLSNPIGLSAVPGGGFLIADQGNCKVRRVFPDGRISTVAGGTCGAAAGDGGPATSATLSAAINDAVMTPDGGVLIADSQQPPHPPRRTRRDDHDRGGHAPAASAGDTPGPAASALLNFPAGLAVQGDGGYLIADNDNHRIRRVTPTGVHQHSCRIRPGRHRRRRVNRRRGAGHLRTP